MASADGANDGGEDSSSSKDGATGTNVKLLYSRNDSSLSTAKPPSSRSDSSSDISLPTPPDGGWGWVVVLASFMVHLIADGCAFSFGVLYVELLDYFGESKGKTAWVGSLFVSVPLMTGPIASALTNRYGCRLTTIVGGIIAAVGFVLSSFANSIEMLCFTFGFISGIGLSMVYVPAVVIVAYYFEKRRAFATGIAVAGSGIGTFVFAPLSEHLIEQYSWKGAVLIIGAIMLNISVCGAVFRPIMDEDETRRNRTRKSYLDRSSRTTHSSTSEHPDSNLQSPVEPLNGQAGGGKFQVTGDLVVHSLVQFPTYMQNEIKAIPPGLLNELTGGNRTLNDIISDAEFIDKYYATQSLTDVTHSVSDMQQNGNIGNGNLRNGGPSTSGVSDRGQHVNGGIKSNHTADHIWQKRNNTRQQIRARYLYDRLRPMYRKDIFYRGSLVKSGGSSYPSAGGRAVSCPDIVMKSHETSTEDLVLNKVFPMSWISFSREVKHIIRQMLDTSILRSVIFVYFSISSMLLYMWYDVPYVYTPDKAIGMGITEEKASYLVSILGIVSTFGQIVIGYLGDRPRVSALHLYNALTSIAGFATLLVPIITTYAGLCMYSGAFGFFISGNYALTTIILVDLLGMEKLTNAYGLVMLGEGISNLIGPPVAGWISDRTGTYDMTFFIAGAGIFISGFMLIIIPLLRRCDPTIRTLQSTSTPNEDYSQVNSNHNNSNRGSNKMISSTHASTETEVNPLFSCHSENDVSICISECETVV